MASFSFLCVACIASMQHLQIRSNRCRLRETTPTSLEAPGGDRNSLTRFLLSLSKLVPQSRSTMGKREASRKLSLQGLQEAHVGRLFQGNSGSLPCYRLAPDLALEQLEIGAWVRKPLLSNLLLRGRPPSLESHPPPQNSLTEISLSLTSLS